MAPPHSLKSGRQDISINTAKAEILPLLYTVHSATSELYPMQFGQPATVLSAYISLFGGGSGPEAAQNRSLSLSYDVTYSCGTCQTVHKKTYSKPSLWVTTDLMGLPLQNMNQYVQSVLQGESEPSCFTCRRRRESSVISLEVTNAPFFLLVTVSIYFEQRVNLTARNLINGNVLHIDNKVYILSAVIYFGQDNVPSRPVSFQQ